MPRTLLRVGQRVVPAAVVICLVVAACATSPAAKSSNTTPVNHLPTLPADARIARSVDVTLPSVSKLSSTLPGANQRDVLFTDARTGFLATGGQATATNQGGVYNSLAGGIQRTTDGGKTWSTVWSAPGADLGTVTFLSPSIGFAAGRLFSTSSTTDTTGQPLWLRTADGGATWTAQMPLLPAAANGVWSVLRFAAGTARVILASPDPNQNGGSASIMLRSVDAGDHWSQVGPPNWRATGGLAFATPTLAFATGDVSSTNPAVLSSRLWRSRDGGQTWAAVPGTQLPFGLNAIDFPDPVHGFAAGGNLAKYEMRPWRGLLATSDGGRTWALRYQSPDADRSNPITRLHFIDAGHGWGIIGGCSEGQNGPCGGSVIVSADGGRSWHTTDRQAVDVSPISPTEGWVIDGFQQAFAWHTVDAGASWAPVVGAGALGIDRLAGSRGWLIAATAAGTWQSHDNGANWVPLDQSMLPPGTGRGNINLLAQPPGLLVLLEDLGLRISHDGGIHAFDVPLPGQDPNSYAPTAVAFSDSTRGVAIVGGQLCTKPPGYTGSGTEKPPVGVPQGTTVVAITGDGGTSWTTRGSLDVQPSGIGTVPGFWAVAGSTNCGAPHPVVMISRDDGKHWSTQRLLTACFDISVASPTTIWLNCGDQLLMTRDGAITWTQYRFPGGVPSVLAVGRDEAWAYGPEGALWHTIDGGLTWNVAPVSF
ncbi:MAG TPA: hypothetical protein VG104_07800 [Candidatus Dormibacteraeota bacterium]|nr:hypothetical protein [Candidatus Dormibacteraeota bacterium]